MRTSLVRYFADTSSTTTIEFGLLAAGVALAIVLVLAQLGGEGRIAARAWLVGDQKSEVGNQKSEKRSISDF